MSNARLVAYAPNGARLGILPEPLEWAGSTPVGEFGALTLSYAGSAAGADILKGRRLDAGLELAVEVWTGSAWVEPEGARYIALRRGRDQADPAGVLAYTAVGYGWITTRVLHLAPSESMYAGPGENEGQRLLTGTPGAIINTLLGEYQARGGPSIAKSFTNTASSKGAAWSGSVELWVGRGEALDAILDRLAALADIDHWWEGRTLCMAATRPGTDRSSSVILRLGIHVSEAPTEDAIEELISVHTLHGGDGVVQTTTEPSAPKPWGRWEGFASDDRITTAGAATARNQRVLADAARERSSYTHDLVASTDLVIGHHVQLGDWITAPGHDVLEQLRIAALQWRFGAEGLVQTLILNDRLLNAELRRLKRERTGESKGATGTGSTIGSPGQDRRTPAKTTGVTASSYSYITPTGGARAGILVDWTAVTQAAPEHGGGLMAIERYEVGYRPGSSGTWVILPFTDRPADITDLPVKAAYQVKVRARGQYSTSPGVWSDAVSVTTLHDTTPPPVPSLPTLSAARGVVTITWDGTTNAAAAQPADFSHVVVEWDGVSVLTGLAVAGVDRLTGRGALDIAQLKPGTTARARLSAVDRTGNASTFTGWASVTVSSVLDDTGLGERLAGMDTATTQAKADAAQGIAGAAAAHGLASAASTTATAANNAAAAADAKADAAAAAAGTADGKATQALTSANGRNARITSTSAPSGSTHPTTGLPLVAGDIWWQWDNVTARNVIGQWEWSGTAWRRELISDQTIASLDVNKLTVAGSARMSQAVADKVIADAGYYGSLTADRMIVASTSNMIPWNPALAVAPHVGINGASISASNEPYYGWAIKAVGGTNVAGTWGTFAQLRPEAPSRRGDVESWDVQPGESFRVRVGFGMRGVWNAAAEHRFVRVILVFLAADGSTWAGSANGTPVSPVVSSLGELRYSEALGTVPAGAVRMRVYLQRLCGNETGATIWVTNPTLVPAVDGSLVVENSITGREIFFDAAFGNKLKAGFAEFDSVLVGAMDGKIITGATIQTAASGARVVLDAGGLKAYNSGGTNTLAISSSTGTLSATGGTITGATIQTAASGARVVLDGNTLQFYDASGRRGIIGKNPFVAESNAVGLTVHRGTRWASFEADTSAVFITLGSPNSDPDLKYDSFVSLEPSAFRVRLPMSPINSGQFDVDMNRLYYSGAYAGAVILNTATDGESGVEVRRGGSATSNWGGVYLYAADNSDGEAVLRVRGDYASSSGQAVFRFHSRGTISAQSGGITRFLPFATHSDIRSVTPGAANTTYSYTVSFPSGKFTQTPAISVTASTSVPERVVVSYGSASSTSVTIYYRRTDTTSFSISMIAIQPTP